MDIEESNQGKILKSTKSGWGIHEIANAIGIFKAHNFTQIHPKDVENGRSTLIDFLNNIKKNNLNVEGQGALSDSEMVEFIEEALNQEWTADNLENLHKKFEELKEKVDN